MAVNTWIMTASGRAFYPLDPDPQQVHFPDVAHHLAQRNRFAGACREPYSVAQHCVMASLETPGCPDSLHPRYEAALAVLRAAAPPQEPPR